jgi:hypothetical protein
MFSSIELNGNLYPFRPTPEGATLLQMREVDFVKVLAGDRDERKRYAYYVIAAASIADGLDFNFSIDEFVLACPHNWRAMVDEFIQNQINNDKGTESKEDQEANPNEASKKTKKVKKIEQ